MFKTVSIGGISADGPGGELFCCPSLDTMFAKHLEKAAGGASINGKTINTATIKYIILK